MSSATLSLGAPLDNTMGSMLLGVILSAVLYGISVLQCLFYFTRYGRDPVYLKCLVAATVFLDTLHLSFVIHTIYHYLINNYYNNERLQVMVWSVSVEALPTVSQSQKLTEFLNPIIWQGVTAALVQSFYAHRVWKMSDKNVLLTGLILVLVLATAGQPCAIFHDLNWLITFGIKLVVLPLTISINALSTAADIIITSTLCFMLHRSRPASLETETIINRLILFTINTGLLTSLCAVASLISVWIVYLQPISPTNHKLRQLLISPKTLIYASFYFCIGRLYSNALLASLNAREVIRGRIDDVDTNFHMKSFASRPRISRDIFARPPDVVSANDLAVRIDRQTELYADEGYTKFHASENPSTLVAEE
ncbi:hypothetical protein DFH07DRAFT_1061796 [Mycena maculata]|uniref:DUF6534 domain-containing protein n=1 Tax=Mycena maculata TaxID=230809 RepID=A0AAD7IW01_9AGAR|nr:hypothetical protein DFH07DRAFT_1061796 [Mycena maculata]